MEQSIKQQLTAMAEEPYRKFASSLIPNVDNVLGVRLPALRKLARTIAKGDWRDYVRSAGTDTFEEVMLHGMVIGCVRADVEELLELVAAFVPRIDNWSVCDSFCNGLKFARKHRERVWEFLQPYFASPNEYDVRFAVVMLLQYYADDEYIERTLALLDGVRHEGYYAKMAVAWAVSICYVKLPEPTMAYLRSSRLDDFTYNKALQKIIESLAVSADDKSRIRAMKRRA